MARYFFGDDPNMLYYERLMQQVPGFDKKRETGCEVDKERIDFDEINRINVRIVNYEIPECFRVENAFTDYKHFFLNKAHKKSFTELYLGPKGRRMRKSSRYAAAVYFLSADDDLWELCKNKVGECGIFFKEMKPRGLDLNGFILYMAAKSVYYGKALIDKDELEDSELIGKDMRRIISNGLYVLELGNEIMREAVRG